MNGNIRYVLMIFDSSCGAGLGLKRAGSFHYFNNRAVDFEERAKKMFVNEVDRWFSC